MSRKVLILANVGSRDVKYQGKYVSPAREKGAEIWSRFDELSSEVELPILSPSIRYIESLAYRYPEICESEAEATLRLFYTDQEDATHRSGDTLEFAKIAKGKILDEFFRAKREGFRFKREKDIFLSRVHSDPSRYDYMHRFYEEFLANNQHLQKPEEYVCFVLLTGGTSQMNAMLLLHAVRHFGTNCVQVYVKPGEEPMSLRVGEQISKADARKRFNDVLKSLQFRAAARISNDAFGNVWRTEACRYAEHRLAFDFKRARVSCDEALKAVEGDPERTLERHADDASRLERGVSASDQSLLIAELFYNLEVKHRCGEFVDVLGRCFRLQEALLTWIMESNTAIKTGKERSLSKQEAMVRNVGGLWDFLKKYRLPDGKNLDLGRPINRISLMAVAEYLCCEESGLQEEERRRAVRVVESANSIEKLADLRNEAIVAHGFRGMSGDELIEEYGSDSLIEDLRKSVGDALGRDLSVNPFVELAERLRF